MTSTDSDRVCRNPDDTVRSLKSQNKLPLNKGHPDLSDAFWANLTIFATGMITQATELRELHRHRIQSKQIPCTNMALPQDVRLPSICFTVSDLFASMALDDVNNTGDKVPGANHNEITQPKTGLPVQQHWACDRIAIQFNGLDSASKRPGQVDDESTNGQLMCVSNALICVQQPAKFTSLKEKIDDDVSYDRRTGEFSLRILHAVGEAVLATVKSRVKAIDRFVNFLESLDKAKATVTTEDITLRKVAFTYGEPVDAAPEGEPQKEAQQWRVVLDLSKNDIDIEFEKSNPHLRVVDLSKRLVNSSGGIGALMTWLPSSLPAARAIDKMESAWDAIHAQGKGSLDFSMKAMDWMSMRYTLPGPNGTHGDLLLEVRLRTRRGEPWWHIRRANGPEGPAAADDDFATALKPIWDSKGENWRGFTTSAAGRPEGGVVDMLKAVDDALQALAATGISPTTATSAPVDGGSRASPAKKQQVKQQNRKPPAKAQGGSSQPVVID